MNMTVHLQITTEIVQHAHRTRHHLYTQTHRHRLDYRGMSCPQQTFLEIGISMEHPPKLLWNAHGQMTMGIRQHPLNEIDGKSITRPLTATRT
jgi:hypothetical protein